MDVIDLKFSNADELPYERFMILEVPSACSAVLQRCGVGIRTNGRRALRECKIKITKDNSEVNPNSS